MRTMVALYETEDIARRVETDLLGAGVSRDNVRVEGGVYEDANRPSGGLLGFFRWLFSGDPANDSEVYAESLRRGDWAVIVQLDDGMTHHVEDILYSYDPIDVDARGAYFRSKGWTGYEEGAPVYTQDEMIRDRNDYGSMYTSTYGGDLPRDYDPTNEAYRGDTSADQDEYSEDQVEPTKRDIARGRVRVRTYLSENRTPTSTDGDTQPNRV